MSVTSSHGLGRFDSSTFGFWQILFTLSGHPRRVYSSLCAREGSKRFKRVPAVCGDVKDKLIHFAEKALTGNRQGLFYFRPSITAAPASYRRYNPLVLR